MAAKSKLKIFKKRPCSQRDGYKCTLCKAIHWKIYSVWQVFTSNNLWTEEILLASEWKKKYLKYLRIKLKFSTDHYVIPSLFRFLSLGLQSRSLKHFYCIYNRLIPPSLNETRLYLAAATTSLFAVNNWHFPVCWPVTASILGELELVGVWGLFCDFNMLWKIVSWKSQECFIKLIDK